MKWLHFILSHSIFIAICAAALSFQTYQLLNLPVNWLLLFFIGAAALCGYNCYWLLSETLSGNQETFSAAFKKNIGHIAIILLSAIFILYCLLHLQLVMYNIIVTAILLVLYSVPLWPFKKLAFAKGLGFVKTTLLAFTWTHVTILIPLQKPLYAMNENEWLFFLSRFVFLLMLCIIFDCRDIAIDKIRGLQSLATDLPPVLLRLLMWVLFFLLISLIYFLSFTAPQKIALSITAIAALAAWFLSLKKQGYLFYYFFVDGLMFFSALTTAFASI